MKCSAFISALAFVALLASCHKDSDHTGCTDPIAVNFEPGAFREDGSCQYNQAEQVIWNNGIRGGWNGNLLEAAFRHVVCDGAVYESTYPVDSLEEMHTLNVSTGGGYVHHSYFTLINERNATDFAEGTLRFNCRIPEGGAPEYVKLFIGGKLVGHGNCDSYLRSEFVNISTHSFNDSTFTPVTIPIRNFGKLMMARVEVVCGFQFESERNTGLELDNIRWSANRDPDPIPEPEPEPEVE